MGDTPTREQSPLIWPLVGTIIFVLTIPGTVVVYLPYFLSGWKMGPPFLGTALTRWAGVLLILCALPIFVDFLVRFVRDGRGTPAPVAPTKHLVVTGSFRYARNPAYIAVVALLLGQGLFFASTALLIYTLVVAAAFHLFVILYEEPTLRRQFGAEYEEYCRAVPRWLPRLTPAQISGGGRQE